MFLAAGQLARHPGLSWQLLVLLAGIHLLHVLAMLALDLPWRSWLAAGGVRRAAARFLAIQIPTQLLAVLALLLLAPSHDGRRPLSAGGLALIGAAALAGLGVLLFGPHADDR